MEKEATYENQAPYYAVNNGPMPSNDPRRAVKLIDKEYALAKEIMSIVRMHLTAHPDLDTCKVSRLCEMMLVYV
jgi:hypothetical protein